MAVDAKGPTPAAVGWISSKLEEAGYHGVGIIVNSDQDKFRETNEEGGDHQETC